MIGYLQGKTIYADGQKAIILAQNGIGYELNCAYYVNKGSETGFYITQIVKETDHSLFAFKTIEDKKMFELLLTVNGVGPKSAYSLIGSLGASGVVEAITLEQTAVLMKAPGIGKKAASQILLSLKDKMKDHFINKSLYEDPEQKSLEIDQVSYRDETPRLEESKVIKEAMLALTSLGYKEAHILPIIRKNLTQEMTTEVLIKTALKEL